MAEKINLQHHNLVQKRRDLNFARKQLFDELYELLTPSGRRLLLEDMVSEAKVDLSQYRRLLQSMLPPEQRFAIFLHDRLCRADYCLFYTGHDDESSWNYGEKKQYLAMAKLWMELVPDENVRRKLLGVLIHV